MTTEKMWYEIEATFLDDITCSTNPVFITSQIIRRYGNEILNLVLKQNKTKETKALKDELICRVNSLKVSNNKSSIDIYIL